MVQRLKSLTLYIFYGLLAYAPLHIFLSTWIGTSFNILEPAKIAKDVVLVVGFLLVLAFSVGKEWFRKWLKTDTLLWLILAYVLLNLVLVLIKPTDQDAELLGLVYNTRFLMFFLYAWMLVNLFPEKAVLKNSVKVALASGMVVIVFGIAQYLLMPNDMLRHFGYNRENGVLPVFLIDEKPDLERVMSTVRDPNSLGSYLIIIGSLLGSLFIAAKAKAERNRYSLYLALTALCLWFTFSRSAWIGFLTAMGVLAILSPLAQRVMAKIGYTKIAVIGLSLVVIVGTGLLVFKDTYLVKNVILHADESTVLEDPNELRIRFWRESVQDIAAEPEGSGPGTAGLASIRNNKQGTELNENYYLQIGSELGIAGILLFLGILGLVGYRLFIAKPDIYTVALFASFVGLLITNFLVHIWSNEAVAYTWWGLAGLVLALKSTHRKN